MTISCSGEELILRKERAIYWEKKKMLIISDLHLGKSAHFRKYGIQVPATIGLTDLQRLSTLVAEFSPEILLITGDMFHHKVNSDIAAFATWRNNLPSLRLLLIKGNHDTLLKAEYKALGIEVFEQEMISAPFRFIHHQPETADSYYNISGHIHPGVSIYGKARQQLHLPCFYFGKNTAILPAFSAFTGLSMIRGAEGDRFYAITPTRIFQV